MREKVEPIDERVIDLAEPNTLSEVFPKEEWGRVVSLKITGPLGKWDFNDVLDEICTVEDRIYLDPKDEYGDFVPDYTNAAKIRHLDLGDATFVEGEELPYFGDMAPLNSFVMPKGIVSTFEGFEGSTGLSLSTNLRKITLPDGVKKVGGFSFCTNLTDVVLPDSVEELCFMAFYGCAAMRTALIPDSVQKISGNCYGRTGVRAFEVDRHNECFISVDGVIYSKDLETLVAFPAAWPEKKYVVKSGTRVIGAGAFCGCSIESVELPDSVIGIGSYAFEDSCLKTMDIPNSVKSIGSLAFRDCVGLEHLGLPDDLEVIPEQIVAGCDSLRSISIPATVRMVQENAFEWCPSIKRFVVHDSPNNPDDFRVLDRRSYFEWERKLNKAQ